MILRTYQQQAIDSLVSGFRSSSSQLVVMPTGTGKTVVIQSVAEKLKNSDRDLVYINALDTKHYQEERYFKTWEDVLDVIVKLRFSSKVTVLDIGTLRRQYRERKKGRNINGF